MEVEFLKLRIFYKTRTMDTVE